MADLDLIAKNPLPGDKVRNRRAEDHQTRRVVDRNFGGDVFYRFIDRPGVRYEACCTLARWREFCAGATVLSISVKHLGRSTRRGHAQGPIHGDKS